MHWDATQNCSIRRLDSQQLFISQGACQAYFGNTMHQVISTLESIDPGVVFHILDDDL